MSEESAYLDERAREQLRRAVVVAERRIGEKKAEIKLIKKRIPVTSNFGVRRNEAWRIQQLRSEIEALEAEIAANKHTLRTAPTSPPEPATVTEAETEVETATEPEVEIESEAEIERAEMGRAASAEGGLAAVFSGFDARTVLTERWPTGRSLATPRPTTMAGPGLVLIGLAVVLFLYWRWRR